MRQERIRFILSYTNLEYLNHYVRYKYFEVESLSDALLKNKI